MSVLVHQHHTSHVFLVSISPCVSSCCLSKVNTSGLNGSPVMFVFIPWIRHIYSSRSLCLWLWLSLSTSVCTLAGVYVGIYQALGSIWSKILCGGSSDPVRWHLLSSAKHKAAGLDVSTYLLQWLLWKQQGREHALCLINDQWIKTEEKRREEEYLLQMDILVLLSFK